MSRMFSQLRITSLKCHLLRERGVKMESIKWTLSKADPLPLKVRSATLKVNLTLYLFAQRVKHIFDLEENLSRYYGCGLVIPEDLDGMDVLDLGSGAGQDCFVLSKLVGESGSVTGVDMTDELIRYINI